MKTYANKDGNSGVIGYEIASQSIRLWFRSGDNYLYTYKSAGREIVEKMKLLARKGSGLATFLNRNASDKYEK